MKFKQGDTVKVTIGKDKGQTGQIEKIIPEKASGPKGLWPGGVILPGINIYKKHVKGFGDTKGGVYDIPRPLSLGKIALICPKCKKLTRVGYKFAGSEKVRICKKCGKEIDTK